VDAAAAMGLSITTPASLLIAAPISSSTAFRVHGSTLPLPLGWATANLGVSPKLPFPALVLFLVVDDEGESFSA
jgi:hypothetical protein